MRPPRTTSLLLGLLLASGCTTTPEETPKSTTAQKPPELVSDGPPNAFDLCNRAEESIAAGKLQEALKDLDGAISLEEKTPRAYYLKGVVHRSLQEPKKAVEAFAGAMAVDPDYNDPGFLLAAGEAILDYGQPRVALNLLGRLDGEPTPELWLLSARIKLALGALRAAQADAALAKAAESTRAAATALEAEIAAELERRETHYMPAAAPERLGDGELSLEGLASVRLPAGFKVRAKHARARRPEGDTDVVFSLKKAEVGGDGPAAWRDALAEAAQLRSAYVVASKLSDADPPQVFLHVVEPSPESGMFDPFNIVRYQWLVQGPKGQVLLTAELELPQSQRDLPDAVRQDVLAAVATLKLQ